MKRFGWLWDTYGGLSEHNMACTCRGEDDHPITVFNTNIRNMDTAVSMAFHEPKFVKDRERGYIILSVFTDPSDPDLFQDVNPPFVFDSDAELEQRTKLVFFQAVFQQLKRKETLEAAGSQKVGFEDHIKSCGRSAGWACLAKEHGIFSLTQRSAIVTKMKYIIGVFRRFLGQFLHYLD